MPWGYEPAQWKQNDESDRNFRNLTVLGSEIGAAVDDTAQRVRNRRDQREIAKADIAKKQAMTGMKAEDVASKKEQDLAKDNIFQRLISRARGAVTGLAAEKNEATNKQQADQVTAKANSTLTPIAQVMQEYGMNPKAMTAEELAKKINDASKQVAMNLAKTEDTDSLLRRASEIQAKGLDSSQYRQAAIARMVRDAVKSNPDLSVNSRQLLELGRNKYGFTDAEMTTVPEYQEAEVQTVANAKGESGKGYASGYMNVIGGTESAQPTRPIAGSSSSGAPQVVKSRAYDPSTGKWYEAFGTSAQDASGYDIKSQAVPFGAGVALSGISMAEMRTGHKLSKDEAEQFRYGEEGAQKRDEQAADVAKAKIAANAPHAPAADDTLGWQKERDAVLKEHGNVRRQIDFLKSKGVESSNQLSNEDQQILAQLAGTDDKGRPLYTFKTINEGTAYEQGLLSSLRDIDNVLSSRGLPEARKRIISKAGERPVEPIGTTPTLKPTQRGKEIASKGSGVSKSEWNEAMSWPQPSQQQVDEAAKNAAQSMGFSVGTVPASKQDEFRSNVVYYLVRSGLSPSVALKK